MSYGFLMAPLQFKWFGFLSRAFPITRHDGTMPALKRVAMDQLIFAPMGKHSPTTSISLGPKRKLTLPTGLAAFFIFMTIAEGGGRRALTRKLQDVYMPALKANYILWPAVQIVNFRLVPLQFQIVSACPFELDLCNPLTSFCSRSCHLSVLPGRHTSRSQTPRRTDGL